MAENLNLKTVNTVDTRPFKRLVMTIGELPTSFIESMTYYELLAWFTHYLETVVIPTVNNNAEATKELQDLFTELKNFVDNYFDNLDVQEEINNKLDVMVEDGTLDSIVEPYLESYRQDFLDFEKLMNWDSITTNKYRDETAQCDYYITEIPFQNEYTGNNIIRVGLADDDTTLNSLEEPTDFASRHKSPIVTNGGIFTSTAENPRAIGVVIKDGVVLMNDNNAGTYYRDILCIKENGDMDFVPMAGANPQLILNAGYKDAILGFFGLIKDHVVVDYSDYSPSSIEAGPKNIICRKDNGDYLILTCDGRTLDNKGLSIADCVRILTTYNVKFAFALDGGGSASTVVKGEKINRNIDSGGTVERKVPTLLYLDTTASEIYFEAGGVYNAKKVDDAKTAIKYRQLPYPETYFYGNLYNKDDPNIQTNKQINSSTGEVEDYTNTSGNTGMDLMVSDFIQVPSSKRVNFVNTGDWKIVYTYDEDKRYLGSWNYGNNGNLYTIPVYCAYIRVAVRRQAMGTYGIYLGEDYDANRYIPYKTFKYDTLFYNETGATDVTIGNIKKYAKIIVYAIDGSSQQQARELMIRPSQTNIFANFLRMAMLNTSQAQFFTSRLTINQNTGAFTIDREYTLTANGTPYINGSDSSSDNQIKIMKVEAYY